jgi:Neurotransmitter-gated ion-channel ligand binding domain
LIGYALATLGLMAHPSGTFAAQRKAPETNSTPDADLRRHPTGGKTPVEVSIGLYVTNLVSIDETRESFEVGGYLTAKWHDSRLALTADPLSGSSGGEEATRTFKVENLWTPPIEAVNSISHRTTSYSLQADRTGTVTYVERFDSVLSNNYALRKFPFDRQVLVFELQPFLASAREIRFASQPLPIGMSPDQYIELAAWRIQDIRYTSGKLTRDPTFPVTDQALLQIHIERRFGFYIWKIFLPLLMMTMIPAVVFWVPVQEINWLPTVPMTMLLAMVAFEFVVLRDLPRIGYITFLDAVFLAGFVFCFLAALEITTVFILQKSNRQSLAIKLHSMGRWGYPAGYFALLIVLAICFLA